MKTVFKGHDMEEDFTEVVVHGVVIDPVTNSTIILLCDRERRKVLPIWIGAFEAFSISQALERQRSERPLAHDLIVNLFGETGTTLLRVVIHTLRENTFYSYMVLALGNRQIVRIDSRPSDAVAVALRASAPIYLSEEIYAVATDYSSVLDDKGADSPGMTEFDSSDVREWLDRIKPSDF